MQRGRSLETPPLPEIMDLFVADFLKKVDAGERLEVQALLEDAFHEYSEPILAIKSGKKSAEAGLRKEAAALKKELI